MRQGYFVYNGETYTTGTVMRMKPEIYKMLEVDMVEFLYYDTEYKIFAIRVHTERIVGHVFQALEENFYEDYCLEILDVSSSLPLEEANEKINPKLEYTFTDELSIDLGPAWILYIVLMIVSLITVVGVVLWIPLSICFITYRRSEMKNAGWKI